MERIILTPELLNSLKEQTIEWFAYGYSGNMPYAGKCTVLGSQYNEKRQRTQPLIQHISGDNLTGAWLESHSEEQPYYTYSDGDRPVFIGKEFENYTLQWEGKNMFFHDETCIKYSITLYLANGYTLESIISRTTTADKVRIKETGDIYIKNTDGTYSAALTIL